MNARGVIRSLVEWVAVLAVALGATLLLTSAAAYAAPTCVECETVLHPAEPSAPDCLCPEATR